MSHTEEYKDTPLPGPRLKMRKLNGSLHLMRVMLRLKSWQRSPKVFDPGDIDRPQHKEFVGKIDEVLRNFDEKILSLDHDLVINRTAEKKNTYDALQRCGLINIDPLNKL